MLELGEPPLRRVAAVAFQVGILPVQLLGHLALVVGLLCPRCTRRFRQALVHVVRHRQSRYRCTYVHHAALVSGHRSIIVWKRHTQQAIVLLEKANLMQTRSV